jgi:hypothetical protein
LWDTHKVNGNDLAVQVDPYTRKPNTSSKTLRLIAEQLLLQRGRNSVGEKNPRGGILSNTEMVVENVFDKLIARLVLLVVGDMLERLISRNEESIVLVSAVEQLSEFLVLFNELKELLGIVALGDEFVGSMVCKVTTCSTKDGGKLFSVGLFVVD